MAFGDFKNIPLSNKASCESIKTMYKRGQTTVCDRSRELRPTDSQTCVRKVKSRHRYIIIQSRLDKNKLHYRSKTANNQRSRDSSTSSTKYGDAELNYSNNLNSRTPSPFTKCKSRQKSRCSSIESTEKKSKTRIKSRCSSADSRTSSKASSRASRTRTYKPVDRDYRNLEKKVAELQRLMKKDYVICESDK